MSDDSSEPPAGAGSSLFTLARSPLPLETTTLAKAGLMSRQPQSGCWGVSNSMGHRPSRRLGLLTWRD